MRPLLSLIALAGCVPPEDVEPLPCNNPEPGIAELGEGDQSTGFLELEDGDDVHVSFGPQGMHMLILSVRVTDLEAPSAADPGTDIGIAILWNEEVVGGTTGELQPSAQSEDTTEFLGMRPIFTLAEVEDLADEQVDLDVTVQDGCGRLLESSKRVRLLL